MVDLATSLERMTPQANLGAATESAHASPEPAQAGGQQQQQGATTAIDRDSANAAQQSNSAQQKHPDPAGSRRFTPAQQAVVAALMVVLKRAMKDGKDAALAAKDTLISNNSATQPLLELLPESEPLPTMQQVEQKASKQLLKSLTQLAYQCKSANVKPLEVFTRSVQCTTREALIWGTFVSTEGKGKRQQSTVLDAEWCQLAVRALHKLGVKRSVGDLIATYLELLKAPQTNEQNTAMLQHCLNHMLPGTGKALREAPAFIQVPALMRLVPSFTAALQAYQIRAAQCGQSFEHMVLLEAAVQCWTLASDAGKLLRAMIAAEPPLSPMMTLFFQAACHATSSAAAKGASQEKHSSRRLAWECVKKSTPPHLAPIFKWMLKPMDLLDHDNILEDDQNTQKELRKTLRTELFPGVWEELYCALDGKNANMREALLRSAAGHVESYVQAWMILAKQLTMEFSLTLDLRMQAQGFEPSELPPGVRSAIFDISSRLAPVTADDLVGHIELICLVEPMHNGYKAGEDATGNFWFCKALAQLFDLTIHNAQDAKIGKAINVLFTGPLKTFQDPWVQDPRTSDKEHAAATNRTMKEIFKNYAQVAGGRGMTLRSHLENIVEYDTDDWGSGKSDVAHLIDILADRVYAKKKVAAPSQEVHPGEVLKLGMVAQEFARVIETTRTIAKTMERFNYAAILAVFPGLPRKLAIASDPDNTRTGPEILMLSKSVTQQIQVHRHIASVLEVPIGDYLVELLEQQGVSTIQPPLIDFCEATCDLSESMYVDIDVAMAKKEHINMCITALWHSGVSAGPEDPVLVLLGKLIGICTSPDTEWPPAKAISQILPGLLECLIQQHQWPHGLDKHRLWLIKPKQLIADISARHTRNARRKDIPLEEHIRNVMAVRGLKGEEAEFLVNCFKEFWAAQDWEAAAHAPETPGTDEATSARHDTLPADSSASAEEHLSSAKAGGGAAHSNCRAADAQDLDQHGTTRAADVAADAAEGTDSKRAANQAGESMPAQDKQEPKSNMSEAETAEKAEKRKAKKARQRAARAQAAAQTAEAEGAESKDLSLAEKKSSASKQESSAEEKAAKQLPDPSHTISDSVSADADNLLAPTTPAQSSEVAAKSRSPSISPQPTVQLQTSMPQGQQEPDLPRLGFPAGRAAEHAAQEEEPGQEPWQEVRASRRKPVSQAAPFAGSQKAQKQSRHCQSYDQGDAAASPSRPRTVQPAAQHTEQAPIKSEKAGKVPQPQAGHVASGQLPDRLSALSISQSKQPSQPSSIGPLKISCLRSSPSSVQNEPSQASAAESLSDQHWMAPQQASCRAFSNKEDDLDDDDLCIVCWEKAREIIFYHCMHMTTSKGKQQPRVYGPGAAFDEVFHMQCACQGCAGDIMAAGALCPMCRANIHSIIKARF